MSTIDKYEMRDCLFCGRVFHPVNANQVYCSKKCRKVAAYRKALGIPPKYEDKIKNRNERLERLAREADEHGMSYGYYVAWLRQQEEKKNENVDDHGVADSH